jgi:hypothetical protein
MIGVVAGLNQSGTANDRSADLSALGGDVLFH